jgi:hypothetical protein
LGQEGEGVLDRWLQQLNYGFRFSFIFFEWRAMLPKDLHKFILNVGLAIVLCVELYRFIRFIGLGR